MNAPGISNGAVPIWSAPATSANLGSGFDTLGLALDRRMMVGAFPSHPGDDELAAYGLKAVSDSHPAAIAYRAAGGGDSVIAVGGPVPPGRGLGYSAAARAAGAACGYEERGVRAEEIPDRAYETAATLEGHRDNAAAACYGGIVVAAPNGIVRLAFHPSLRVLTWTPDSESSTAKSRSELPDFVAFSVACSSVAHVAALVGALGSGNDEDLKLANGDQLHEPARLEKLPESRAAIEGLRSSGAPFVYLSGSGPTVAAIGSHAVLHRCHEQFGPSPGARMQLSTISTTGLVAETAHK